MQFQINNIFCDEILPLGQFPGIQTYLQYDDPVIDFRFNNYIHDDDIKVIDLSDQRNVLNVWISEGGLLQEISLIVYSFSIVNENILVHLESSFHGVPHLKFDGIDLKDKKYFIINNLTMSAIKYLNAFQILFYSCDFNKLVWVNVDNLYFGFEKNIFKGFIYSFKDNEREIYNKIQF